MCADTRNWRFTHEILVHADNATEEEIAAIERWVDERTVRTPLPAGNGKIEERRAWRDERSVRVSVVPLREFQKIFIIYARRYRNLVVGYDLPRALAKIARRWDAVEKGRFVKGWALEILPPPAAVNPCPNPTTSGTETGPQKTNRPRKTQARRGPSVFVKVMAGGAQLIALKNCGKGRYDGQFLDLARLAYAFSTEERSLEEALVAFTGELPDPDPDPVANHRRNARAILSLAETLCGIFDLLPVSRARLGGKLSEAYLQSPAGPSRAFARHVGFGAPVVPRDRLGASAAAFFGGRIGAQYRGEMPGASVDFSKTYPMIAALLGIQAFLSAEEIRFEEATDDARYLAEHLTIDDLMRPTTWPRLAILCWVRLDGDVVPTTFIKERGGLGNGMPHRWSDELVPLLLPDVIAARMISASSPGTGKAPEIIKAERLVPISRRPLRSVRLPSGVLFDPVRQDVFCVLVEEGERLKLGIGRWKEVPDRVRETCLYPAWKASNNGFAFGDLARTDIEDLAGAATEEVTLVHDGGEIRVETTQPESPGPFFCMPLAALVTSGARLLLAMLDALVAAKGSFVAAGHTDSAHFLATEQGGAVECEAHSSVTGLGGGHLGGGRKVSLPSLSRTDIEDICGAFLPLKPFDPALMPGSPLKIDRMGGTKLILTPSHYCHVDDDGRVVDWTMSHIGEYLPPVPNWGPMAWHFMLAFWRTDYTALDEMRLSEPWLGYPAVRPMALSQPSFAAMVADVATRPFERFLAAQAVGLKSGEATITTIAVAPYDDTPERWASLAWRSYATGELVPFDKPAADGRTWRLRTIEDALKSCTYAHPHAALDYQGRPCDGRTRGPLMRMAMRDGRKFVTGKDRIGRRLDDPSDAFSGEMEPEIWPTDGKSGLECDWPTVRKAAAVVGARALAKKLGVAKRSAERWLTGKCEPADQQKVAAAVAACVMEIDPTINALLGLGEVAGDEAFCVVLPEGAALMQVFLAAAIDLVARIEGMRAAARTARIPENTLRDWRRDRALILKGEIQPLGKTVANAARLGRGARARIKAARKRFTFWPDTVGDYQAIYVALALALGQKIGTEPPWPDALRGEMEQLATCMLWLWIIEAVAAASPLAGLVIAVVAICVASPTFVVGASCPRRTS